MKGMNMYTKIIEQLEAALGEEFRLVDNDLGALIHLVRKKMQLFGQGLRQRIVGKIFPSSCGYFSLPPDT